MCKCPEARSNQRSPAEAGFARSFHAIRCCSGSAHSGRWSQMTHYRIIGSIWLLFGISGLALSAIECARLLRVGDLLTDGATVSTFIGSGFCALAAAASVGLLRAKRWARIVFAIIAVLFGLYCLSFLAMVGLEFGAVTYALFWLGVAFVAYTLIVVTSCRPDEQNVG
jgi:hypothetical protein